MIIGGGLFYWFQWRPNQIRKNCYKEDEEFHQSMMQAAVYVADDKSIYDNCLLKNGLEK